jgi:hypothetical protein
MLLAVVVFALAAIPARAAVCNSSFTDVSDTASYCLAAQWLKARSITLGCTDTAHFCPDDAVTRAQMALFLNRMGGALAPVFESVVQTFAVSANAISVVCQTSLVDMGGFNHVATGDASAYVSGTGTGQAQFRLVYSVDGGATWLNWATFYIPVTVATDMVAASSTSSSAYFGGSQTVMFGLQVTNTSNASVLGGCEVRARIENSNVLF